MRKFERGGEPDFLADKWENWGLEWEHRRKEKPAAQFHWHEINGVKVNQMLLPFLKKQTQDHCSFCDAFPVAPPSIETIEHFRPKTVFHRDAYRWTNLYFCCMYCQQKGEDFDESLLQPDADGYEFDRYFCWDFTTGEIKINTLATPQDQHRADVTIKLYRLNEGHPRLRKLAMQIRLANQDIPADDLDYRHYA
jgi:uncharacterized protein (TIGR02646 family)